MLFTSGAAVVEERDEDEEVVSDAEDDQQVDERVPHLPKHMHIYGKQNRK